MATWYLAVDMQLFALSPLILFPLWKRSKCAVYGIIGLLFLSIGIIVAQILMKIPSMGPSQK